MMPFTNDDLARLAIDGWAAMSTNVRLGDMPSVSAVRQSHRVEQELTTLCVIFTTKRSSNQTALFRATRILKNTKSMVV